jgi:hypothetical protein
MRIIDKTTPLLLVAFVALGCEKDGPTVPLDGPDLAFNCDKLPDHPKCSGGEEPPHGGQYTPIDLELLCRQCDGVAHDIGEQQGELLHVAGWIDQPLGSPNVAVVWTGTPADIGDVDPVVLEPPNAPYNYGGSWASGINDAASLIVGGANGWYPKVPVAWQPEGDRWATGQVLALADADSGDARDVNNDGMIAGRLFWGSNIFAVVWASPAAEPVKLFTPGSAALGLNNDGDVVGGVEGKSALWTAEGSYCDLHPDGASESVVWRIEDRFDGNVLIAGRVSWQPAVWTVTVPGCAFIIDTIAGAPERKYSRALDVRRVDGGWEAVGTHDMGRYVQPIVWYENGSSSELLNERYGNALVINSVGYIVGNREHKGRSRAVLWTK